MVTWYEGESKRPISIEDARRRETLMAHLVEADLRVADLLQAEPDSIVAYDYERTWRPKITAAINDGRHGTSNFPLFRYARGDEEYIQALQEILGALGRPFTVGQGSTVFQKPYTIVIW